EEYRELIDEHKAAELPPPWEETPPKRKLPVAAVSATIPATFPVDAGLSTGISEYESPFADAYGESMLYIPRPIVDGVEVPTRTFGRRVSMDTRGHATWAERIMKRLVEASGGRALVLSATVAAGQQYAHALRTAAAGRWTVYSQWDGVSKDITTSRWREDETSVLVGTRSYMTGVDAPGPTCSLVIIDRVPRGAGNVVDDARVEVLAEESGEFRARDLVYAVDAAQLLEQGAGRLIRSISDSGMVAVLDPRLLKGKDITYPGSTRKIYMNAFRFFSQKTARLATAEDYLRQLSLEEQQAA
ncbi:MAG TPA: helicase C-terminal domain-containing protein, partial [Beutenbergiaceae bacterium]|nr:helicase C-terminal domain-containing protein [Beutenbergiaceae bacterium]